MKKKTITTLAALATAAVVLIGGYISKYDSDKSPLGVTAQDSVSQSSITQNSSYQKADAKNSFQESAAIKNSSDKITDKQSKSEKSSATKDNSEQSSNAQNSTAQNTQQLEKITFPEAIVKTQKKGIAPFGYIGASVTKVIDGDTFHIKYANKDYKVRMLDIDTPESVKASVNPQPYAKEASDLTKEILTGKKVKLVFEKDTTDQYDRLLAHVILEDGTYYNALMVQNGYAIAVFYSPNTLLKDYFSELQSNAIDNEAGFWQLPESEIPFIADSKGKLVAAYKLKAEAA
ncbi:MAG: thermonuclease family protein [Ruminiclostridium sp.]